MTACFPCASRYALPATTSGKPRAENGEHEETDYRLKGVLPMTDNKRHDTRTARRPDCVTEIRMGNSVLVVSGYFKKDTTTTAADKMARVLEAEAALHKTGNLTNHKEADFTLLPLYSPRYSVVQ